MNCRNIELSPEKSAVRFAVALKVFHPKVLYRIVAFVLYLLGAKRNDVADATDIPLESLKTAISVINKDGFPALRDRRRSNVFHCPKASQVLPLISVRRDDALCLVEFCEGGHMTMKIPLSHKVQVRTVLLSLLNAGLISTKDTAAVLRISEAHCRELSGKLLLDDIPVSLMDKRQGQVCDYRVGSKEKAEIIKQFAARAVTGHSTSSETLAGLLTKQTHKKVSPRTVRWHMEKLGLRDIKKSLPELVKSLKKTHNDPS